MEIAVIHLLDVQQLKHKTLAGKESVYIHFLIVHNFFFKKGLNVIKCYMFEIT